MENKKETQSFEERLDEAGYKYSLYYPEARIIAELCFKKGAHWGRAEGRSEAVADFDEILDYCEPHLDQMWAARIVGIILKCDFRDCKSELAEFREKRGLR